MKAGDKVYLVKYALTSGIEARTVYSNGMSGDYVYVTGFTWTPLRPGKEVFASLDEAKAAAESMRLKKIAALRKQIAKLEKLDFSAPASVVVKG